MTDAIFPDLKDASVFISGGASGIGAALTDGFLGQGAKVAIVDIIDAGEFAARMETRHGRAPFCQTCDVTDIPALQAAIAQAAKAHGPITVLVNNAANDTRHDPLEIDEAYWDRNQAVNLKHQFFAVQAVVPGMKAAGGGRIINLSSTSYMIGMGDLVAYTTAKAGITGMTRSLARAYGPDRIRVNAVMPGWVLTERQLKLWATPENLEAFKERICLPDHMTTDDMVGPVLFLASSASSVITGQAIVVDAGLVMTG
jgi:galactose dehydrogenase